MTTAIQDETKFKVVTTVELALKNVRGLLCSALEGGSNYWYMIENHEFSEGVTREDFREGGRFTDPNEYWHPDQLIPFHPGCTVIFSVPEDEDGKRYHLNLEAIQKGLEVMAEKYPKHFADLLQENDDGDTGDVFLQCCLFGEIVYG